MSKADDVFEIINQYSDGLSCREISTKLPNLWFSTDNYSKEVSNAIQVLKTAGRIESHDPDHNGVLRWRVKPKPPEVPSAAAPVPAPEATPPEAPSAGPADVVFDPVDGAGLTLSPAEPELPAGVRRAVVYLAEDETQHETPEAAAAHNERSRLEVLINQYIEAAPPQSPKDYLTLILGWEEFKARAAE